MESKAHRKLKEEIAGEFKDRGYSVTMEKRLDEFPIIVDVFAQSEEETIAVEVGTLQGEDRVKKLEKVVDTVIHYPQFGKPKVRKEDLSTISFPRPLDILILKEILDNNCSWRGIMPGIQKKSNEILSHSYSDRQLYNRLTKFLNLGLVLESPSSSYAKKVKINPKFEEEIENLINSWIQLYKKQKEKKEIKNGYKRHREAKGS